MPPRMNTELRERWKSQIIWSIKHLVRHGDTDIFPVPIEYQFIYDASDSVADQLSLIELQSHTPISLIDSLVPKGKLSFRTAHQMFPIDCVLFTAVTAMLGNDI